MCIRDSYLREVSVPDGYLIEQSVIPVEFTYENQFIACQIVDCLHSDKQTTVETVSYTHLSDPKNLASMGRQRLACQRAARKLQWGVQKERISETNEPVPLLMRPAVKEILQDAEQHRFDVLLIGNRDSLCCDAADMESFLTVLNSFNIHIFAGGQGSWVEPNGRHYAPLPRLPWQEDDCLLYTSRCV